MSFIYSLVHPLSWYRRQCWQDLNLPSFRTLCCVLAIIEQCWYASDLGSAAVLVTVLPGNVGVLVVALPGRYDGDPGSGHAGVGLLVPPIRTANQ